MLNDIASATRSWPLVPYLIVLAAAAVEGEVAYVGAAMLVAAGRLNAIGVAACGAIGAAIGDQAYFYLCRGHVHRWLERHPPIAERAAPLVALVRRRDWLMVLLIRFTPGLRIAIAVACACANVSPRRFTIINFLSAIVWAVSLMALVGSYGPRFLARFGLDGWKGGLVTSVSIIGLFILLGAWERRAISRTADRALRTLEPTSSKGT